MCMQSRPDCEEDAYQATGAESSRDEGENAGPGEVHSELMNNLLFVLQISLLFVFLCI